MSKNTNDWLVEDLSDSTQVPTTEKRLGSKPLYPNGYTLRDRISQEFSEILFFSFDQSWLPYFKLPKHLANLNNKNQNPSESNI
jgi:hypothetical protein